MMLLNLIITMINEIIKIKNIIFAKISELVQDHASLNGIELIIEKNQYLIANR